ncbi:hypothetical protein EDD16DRAFT_1709470 [Pisolithus croceorrhizus]|nr:hypothetical protein EDD16DRAFT_1709470 [Pisolithus croceorrhizus]KAI6134338.1 hypothetical protein EV401DRAFT_2064087 [Pisolithus croceorrhizus]KAI6146531.1 hypothetical protein EDD17DRAFT_1767668 [Pisolithus thermaeus]
MTPLHSFLTNDEQQHHQPSRSSEPLFFPVSDRPTSPIGAPINSAFQDSVACHPIRPDGPRAPWDPGLNLSNDPITTAEYDSLDDCEIRTKRRRQRLHSATIVFELLFGLWGVYTTIRYFLAFSTAFDHTQWIFALALGAASAVAVAANILSITSPLLHDHLHVHSWNRMRFLLRACYLLLLLSASTTNLVLVAAWHPSNLCKWDIDLSWYTSTGNTPSTRCHPTSFAVWIIAATTRQLVTSIMAVLFIYVAHASCLTGNQSHTPAQRKRRPYRTAFSFTDPEDSSPTDMTGPSSSTLSTIKHVLTSSFMRPSQKQLGRSNSTLVRSNSSGTIVPFPPHTASVQASPSKGMSLNNNAMPLSWLANSGTSFNANVKTRVSGYPSWAIAEDNVNFKMEATCQQPQEGTPTKPRILRRTSRLWESQDGLTSHIEKTTLKRTSDSIHCGSMSVGEAAHADTSHGHDSDVDRESDQSTTESEILSHIYGQSHLYPQAVLHNPPSSPSDANTQDEGSCSPRSDMSTGEDDEYIPMMGGYVRRMSTIESLGSKEVSTLAGTTSFSTRGSMSTAGSICPSMMMGSVSSSSSMGAVQACGRPPLPALHFSTLRLGQPSPSHAGLSLSVPPSLAPSGSGTGTSRSTVYLSVSSGSVDGSARIETTVGSGARMRVSERGELLVPERPPASGASSPTSCGPNYWTASSGQSALSNQNSSLMTAEY